MSFRNASAEPTRCHHSKSWDSHRKLASVLAVKSWLPARRTTSQQMAEGKLSLWDWEHSPQEQSHA